MVLVSTKKKILGFKSIIVFLFLCTHGERYFVVALFLDCSSLQRISLEHVRVRRFVCCLCVCKTYPNGAISGGRWNYIYENLDSFINKGWTRDGERQI